jgi:NADPH:quinone reductase-like Zn-dependent oxidoreductase
MKAIILEKAGWIENLVIKDIAKPTIKSNEVLIETKALSINPADAKAKYSQEMIDMMFKWAEQIIFGWDVAWIVSEVGEDVEDYKVWDKVFGMVNFPGIWNAYAE